MLLGAACGGSDPDTVVGVVTKCDTQRHTLTSGDVSNTYGPETGAGCYAPGIKNARKEVTVKTAEGKTYTAEVGFAETVNLGDPWPPK